jgi:REP element-mobilizing transposase RayT
MSKKYKFADNDKIYFVSFATTNWIDVFIRNEYKDAILNSIRYCQLHKDLELYGWCIMTSHVHLIIGTNGNPLQNIMRDLKRHTAEILHKLIQTNTTESRREWMLWIACPDLSGMERAAKKNNNPAKFQLWQPESHPIQLMNNEMAHQKLDYIHNNPVDAGFVTKAEEWTYSSAIDYYGGKGLLEISRLDTLIV